MGSQKQSHRVRKLLEQKDEKALAMQIVIKWLIKQNCRLAAKVRRYESKPKWWKFSERRKWEVTNAND